MAAVTFESRSVELPYFGYYSVAFPLYMVMALHPGVGFIPTLGALLVGLAIRAVRHRKSLEEMLGELVADLVAVLAALLLEASTRPSHGLLAAAAYFLLTFLVPRVMAIEGMGGLMWFELQRDMVPLYLAAAAMGPILLLVFEQNGWLVLVMFPVLIVGQIAARALIERTLANAALQPLQARASGQARSQNLKETLKETQQDLEHTAKERKLLEELVRIFAAAPDLTSTLESSLSVITRLVRCDSAVFFLEDSGRLRPALGRTPDRDRLAAADRLNLTEPVVLESWERRRLVLAQERHQQPHRLFEKEYASVALPLQSIGVLYVGRALSHKFSREELKLLALIGDQTIPAIHAARRYTQLQAALEEQAETNQKLTKADQQKSHLLDGFDRMATSLETERLFGYLQELLTSLIPHHLGFVMLDGRLRHLWVVNGGKPPESEQSQLLNLCAPLLQAVLSDGKSRLLTGGRSADLIPSGPFKSYLAVSLASESELRGVMVLTSRKADLFQNSDLELLDTVGYHLSAVLENSRLFEELRTSQANLVQSSKMAAVGQLAAGVAHELNTPLGSIMVAIDSVLDNVPAGRPQKRLEKALEQVERAQSIVEKLLYYSRQAGKVAKVVSLQEILVDTLELLGNQLTHCEVRVEGDFTAAPPIKANANEVQQVFFNLLLNARDALLVKPPEERWIRVSAEPQGKYCRLVFQDNGPGVDPEIASRVFEPFFTTKDVGKGTGLGLSICRQIIEGHDGTLELETPPEGGCRFVMRLPLSP